jgi:BirA family biotin operon repressor/biotin-[acetyl-CoA-carboxylase] ligase
MKRAEFEKATAGLPFQRLAFYETVGSTNDVVADWAREGAGGLCLAAADEQTQGRGRSGRRWLTPPGSAIAFSLLLDTATPFDSSSLSRASGLGALTVSEALEATYGLTPQIKWPNDVLLGGRKVCGVLPEAHWTGDRLQALILGVGINVAAESVPSPALLAFPATSVQAEAAKPIDTPVLLRAVLERLLHWQGKLAQPEFLAAWERRLAYRGQRVRVESGGSSIEATLLGLAAEGGLRLDLDGSERVFQAGEVHLRPVARDEMM